jgi:hypothetical protein
MNKITKKMILECYEAFKSGTLDKVPKGMNPSSAKMTMQWLNSILNTGQSYNRGASLLQYRVILEKIRQDYGIHKAAEAALVLMDYCQENRKDSHLDILFCFLDAEPTPPIKECVTKLQNVTMSWSFTKYSRSMNIPSTF